MNPEWIGSAAGILTTLAYVPQLIRVLRHKHTTSISLSAYVILNMGVALWIVYGVLIGSFSVIVANSIGILITLAILLLKLRHG